jgi:hypothetical protein
MATIERRPLPPPNAKATTITEADRAEIIARANDVIDHYLNGPGSYLDSGTRKPLVGEFGDNTVADLNNFKNSIIASMQFADDPHSIMQSVADLVRDTIKQVEQAARINEGRDSISLPPPDTNDPIHIPKIVGGSALPVSLPTEERPALLPPADNAPVRRLARLSDNTSPAMPVVSSDSRNSWDDRFGNVPSSRDDVTPRDPNLPMSPPQTEGPLGIVSGKPMRFIPLPIFDTRDNSNAASGQNWFMMLGGLREGGKSQASAINAGAPAVPFVSVRQNPFGNRNGAASGSGNPDDAFAPPTSAPQNPQGPLSALDASAPAATLVPSDDSNFSGGLLGRVAALMGVDLQNPDQLASAPQDNELHTFYRDPAQLRTLQRLR